MHQQGHDQGCSQQPEPQICWAALEYIIRADPAKRGLTSAIDQGQLIGQGQLEAAAMDLAEHGRTIGIVTGSCVSDEAPRAAETEGSPGALFLAKTLDALGLDVMLIADSLAMPLLKTGCDLLGLSRERLVEFPFESGQANDVRRTSNAPQYNAITDAWVDEFLAGPGGPMTHLISIGRCGPSHHLESITERTDDPTLLQQFEQQVPVASRDVCHNIRGESINGLTAKTHRLFEILSERELPMITIAVGDGGNELGMGRFPWVLIQRTLACALGKADLAGRIPCRIAVDLPLVAGVSNWGAYAIAAAVAALRSDRELLDTQRISQQRELIESLFEQAGALDGAAGQQTVTTNGIELDAYLSVLTDLLALCRGAC